MRLIRETHTTSFQHGLRESKAQEGNDLVGSSYERFLEITATHYG
jgi:hypothetical protein